MQNQTATNRGSGNRAAKDINCRVIGLRADRSMFRTQHEWPCELALEANSRLGSGTASSLIVECTELFIKNHLPKVLTRWDLILGATDPESPSRESVGGLSKRALSRVQQSPSRTPSVARRNGNHGVSVTTSAVQRDAASQTWPTPSQHDSSWLHPSGAAIGLPSRWKVAAPVPCDRGEVGVI